jgi:hypothetical protein
VLLLSVLQGIHDCTYRVIRIHVVDSPDFLCGLHDGSSLNGDTISESFAFAVYDTGYEDVASNSKRLCRLNDSVVR